LLTHIYFIFVLLFALFASKTTGYPNANGEQGYDYNGHPVVMRRIKRKLLAREGDEYATWDQETVAGIGVSKVRVFDRCVGVFCVLRFCENSLARRACRVVLCCLCCVLLLRAHINLLLSPPPPSQRMTRLGSSYGECSFVYRYILRESCSQFDSLPLTSSG
jgi:hypothetical protein